MPWHYGEITFAGAHSGFIQKTTRAGTAECDLLLLSCRLGPTSGTEEDVGSWACLAAGFWGVIEHQVSIEAIVTLELWVCWPSV